MCSKAGEDGPLLFPFVNISCRRRSAMQMLRSFESFSSPQTLDEWKMGIAVLVYVTVQAGSETALRRDSFSKEPCVLPRSNEKPAGMDWADLFDAGWARCHRQSSLPIRAGVSGRGSEGLTTKSMFQKKKCWRQ